MGSEGSANLTAYTFQPIHPPNPEGDYEVIAVRIWHYRRGNCVLHPGRRAKLSLVCAIRRRHERQHELRLLNLPTVHGRCERYRRFLHPKQYLPSARTSSAHKVSKTSSLLTELSPHYDLCSSSPTVASRPGFHPRHADISNCYPPPTKAKCAENDVDDPSDVLQNAAALLISMHANPRCWNKKYTLVFIHRAATLGVRL